MVKPIGKGGTDVAPSVSIQYCFVSYVLPFRNQTLPESVLHSIRTRLLYTEIRSVLTSYTPNVVYKASSKRFWTTALRICHPRGNLPQADANFAPALQIAIRAKAVYPKAFAAHYITPSDHAIGGSHLIPVESPFPPSLALKYTFASK